MSPVTLDAGAPPLTVERTPTAPSCEPLDWSGKDHHQAPSRSLIGSIRILQDKGIKSPVLALDRPLCDWNGKPVSEIELQGEEGAPILSELEKVVGQRISIDTNAIFEALLPNSRRSIWATYIQGTAQSPDAKKKATKGETVSTAAGDLEIVTLVPLQRYELRFAGKRVVSTDAANDKDKRAEGPMPSVARKFGPLSGFDELVLLRERARHADEIALTNRTRGASCGGLRG